MEPQIVVADERNGSPLLGWTLGGESALAVAFFEFSGTTITKIVDFWPEPYDPPPGAFAWPNVGGAHGLGTPPPAARA